MGSWYYDVGILLSMLFCMLASRFDYDLLLSHVAKYCTSAYCPKECPKGTSRIYVYNYIYIYIHMYTRVGLGVFKNRKK